MLDIFRNLFGGGANREELMEAISEGAYLVDVRSSMEFNMGSVKGAVNIPLERVRSEVKKFKGKKNVILFCASGNRSGQAKSILESNGIKNVHNGGSVGSVRRMVEA